MSDPFAPLEAHEAAPAKPAPSPSVECLMPVPKIAPAHGYKHPELGPPVRRFPYRDAEGRVLFEVWRFHTADGGKEFRPLALWRCADGHMRWRFAAPPAPRPLYNLDKLAARAHAPVLVVEGEKAALHAGDLLKDYVPVTSPNGAGGAASADWSALAGRDVVIWPDADEEGRAYAHAAAGLIAAAGAARVRIVAIDDHYPPGWDLGDVGDRSRPQPRFIDDTFIVRAVREALVFKPSLSSRAQPINGTTHSPGSRVSSAAVPSPGMTDFMVGITGAALQAKDFAPIRWIVPEFIVEGLTLLAGKPKIGKSWAGLNLALAVAAGGRALSAADCEAGDVLALTLEDNERRLKSRLTQMLGDAPWPARVTFHTRWPRLDEGGLGAIDDWVARAERPRLVLVDVLAKVRGPSANRNATQYAEDFAAMSAIQLLASKHRIGIVVLHHASKRAGEEDPFDLVSGTTGLTGAADSTLVLKKDRDTEGADAFLYGRGRDLPELEKAMRFDGTRGWWSVLGDADAFRKDTVEKKVLKVLEHARAAMGPKDIQQSVAAPPGSVKSALSRLVENGKAVNVGRKYVAAGSCNLATLEPSTGSGANAE